MRIISTVLLILGFISISCMNGEKDKTKQNSVESIGYDLKNPDRVIYLPNKLVEISGIDYSGGNLLACVQDEMGIIYFYDIEKEEIEFSSKFASRGDYEGIVIDDNVLYVLRSDGVIFRKRDYLDIHDFGTEFKTKIPSKDIEGLCLDKKENRLLIASKSGYEGGKEKYKDDIVIYSFDLETDSASKKPAINIDLDDLEKYAKKNEIEFKSKKGFRPSEIAVNKETGDIYIISGADYYLLVLNDNLEIKYFDKLDKNIFPQAEGMTFLEDGTLIISNEGRSGKANLTFFKLKK